MMSVSLCSTPAFVSVCAFSISADTSSPPTLFRLLFFRPCTAEKTSSAVMSALSCAARPFACRHQAG